MDDYAATVLDILVILVAAVLIGEAIRAIWRRFR